jgi:hypothetical protein
MTSISINIKQPKTVLTIILIILLASLLIFSFVAFSVMKNKPSMTVAEKLRKTQLEQLDALRKDTKPLTEEEIKQQSDELTELHKKQKTFSADEIKNQLIEIDKLRQGQ